MEEKRGLMFSLNKEKLFKTNRSQVTIFIIIAIVIISAILIFFLWIKPTYFAQKGELNFEECVADAVEGEINNLGVSGGFADPEFYYLYEDDKIGYLCYTNLYYKPCAVLKPFLKNHFEEQLEKVAKEKINKCYENSVAELKAKGYDVVSGKVNSKIELKPKQVIVSVEAPISVSKQTTKKFRTFKIKINSPIYDMLMIATSILQYETKYGDSDVTSLMTLYPDFIIEKIKRGDGTTIYIIKNKESKTKFQFASRSFVWPPGYGYGMV